MTYDQLTKDALSAAIWITCSPHEWVWTQEQQETMARYCLEATKRLSLWKWLTAMRCTVHENAGSPSWYVADVDNEVLGDGDTPEEAILDAQKEVEPDVDRVCLMR